MSHPWLRSQGTSLVLSLHIQPGAKKTEVVGLHGEALKIRLSALPVDGKANDCLIEFLAATLGVGRGSIELVGGKTSRAKRVRIVGLDVDAVTHKLSV